MFKTIKIKKLALILLAVLFFAACNDGQQGEPGDDDFIESWEFLPFNGRLSFSITDSEEQVAVPEAVLQVANLTIEELDEDGRVKADENGRIVIHQLGRGITYYGQGLPGPTFTFSAPGYESRTFSVDELISGTNYDPYSDAGLPTITYTHDNGAEEELAVYDFEIQLSPG